jgi:trans-aconitate methyltransferase
MTQSWKDVWNRRVMTEHGGGLETLLKLDGFDSESGRIEAADWRVYADEIRESLGLRSGASVFEVGCGSGAFVYALKEKTDIRVGGLDFGAGLIDAARAFMPDGDFSVCEARALETEPKYDYVLATSVFHYFDLAYAGDVLDRMMSKAKKAVAVLDVPSLAMRDAAESLRRASLSQEEYEEKYRGLMHTYYDPAWFEEKARHHGYGCRIFDTRAATHPQKQFRFNAILPVA